MDTEAFQGHGSGSDPRRGIALVIVLGFLSVLVLMAVSLITLTRTERLVAAYSLEGERARHILLGAIYSAVEDLGVDLESTGDFHPTRDRAVFESRPDISDPGRDGGPVSDLELLEGEVINWIPRRFLSPADPDFDAIAIWENDARWFLVFDPQEDAQGRHRILGRYAYLVLDCNGMLDANLLGNVVDDARGWGTNLLREVDAGLLAEIISVVNLVSNRDFYGRFGALADIILMNDGSIEGEGWIEGHALREEYLSDLMPYSFAYDNGYWDWTGTDFITTNSDGSIPLPGGGSVPADPRVWTFSQATQAFEAAGYDAPTNTILAYMWEDYRDEDFRPSGPAGEPDPDYVSCEPIPMVNEIVVSNKLERQVAGGETNWTHSVKITVEAWYPFPGNRTDNPNTYSFEVVTFSHRSSVDELTPSATFPLVGTATYDADTDPPIKLIDFPELSATATNNPFGSSGSRSFRYQLVDIEVQVKDGAGEVVDRVVLPSSRIRFRMTISPSVSLPAGAADGASVCDPRLNHDVEMWQTPVPTLGEVNDNLPGFNVSANGAEEGTNMYVRNSSEQVVSVGEMGFLPTDRAWTTVDLFSEEGKRLLTMFRVGGYTGETNALVNPNTYCTGVLNAVFRKVPRDEWPVAPPQRRLSDDSAISYLVQDMVSVVATGSFASRAGWVTVPALQPGGPLSLAGFNNSQREAIIRNSVGLFNAHQNLYTVIVVAQAVKDRGTVGQWEDADLVTAEKRAAALVWRDPFPNADGRHETFIRVFRYLTE